jgi:2,3-dihydroxyphenylpropionate 1,2-dioxygenase
MGEIVWAMACSHVLSRPEYYKDRAPDGVQRVMRVAAAVREEARNLVRAKPDALIVIANDHIDAFSFAAVPTICVRLGDYVDRMDAGAYTQTDRQLIGGAPRYRLHDGLANAILRQGLHEEFDLAFSWEAPVDHAFLDPINIMQFGDDAPPLVAIWVNCFVDPQPSPRRCYRFGQLIRSVIERSDLRVGLLATGGLSHFPGLKYARLSESHEDFDRYILDLLVKGEGEQITKYSIEELGEVGEHELLNWIVVLGALGGVQARVLAYEPIGATGLAAVSWPI